MLSILQYSSEISSMLICCHWDVYFTCVIFVSLVGSAKLDQGCQQIREFRENQGILFSIRENRENEIFWKIRGNQGAFKPLFQFRPVTFSVLSHGCS